MSRLKKMRVGGHSLNKYQKKVLLDFIGVPFKDQPRGIPEIDELIRQYSIVNEQQYERALTIIVDHELDAESGVTERHFSDLSGLVRDYMSASEAESAQTLRRNAEGRIQDMQDKHLEIVAKMEVIAADAIREASKQFVVHKVQVGNKKPKQIEGILPECFDLLLQLAGQRKNIMMVGPAGCGKTHVASMVAEALELDYASQSCSAGMSESAFTGWLLPIGTNGTFSYVQSEFVRMYENGGIFLLDEIDAADPNVLVFINQAIANKSFSLPQRFTNPLVKKHPDFVCMAAANTFGTGADEVYAGRNQLDGATLDRFKIGTVKMGYSEVIENKLINSDVLEWGLAVRRCIDRNHLKKIMSTRVLIDATDMLENEGWDLSRIADSYFGDWSREEKAMTGGLVNGIV